MKNKKKVWIKIQTFFYFLWLDFVGIHVGKTVHMVRFLFSPLSWLYLLFFHIYRVTRKKKHIDTPVISVGNITIGGTGKSVLIGFLIRNLRFESAGILLRGHKRQKKDNHSLIVSQGQGPLVSVALSGDEARMHALKYQVPVIVHQDRAKAAHDVIAEIGVPRLSYFLLDDGHQHYSLMKACSLVLLDARAPMGNGYCLPIGLLREKNCIRADIIIFSHAADCSVHMRKQLITFAYQLTKKVVPVVFGMHKILAIRQWKNAIKSVYDFSLQGLSVAVIAGIGSFAQFLKMVATEGAHISFFYEYPDHYLYSLEDIIKIMHAVREKGVSIIVTTEKDWVKIYALLHNTEYENEITWMVIEITFACTSRAEERILLHAVHKKIISWYLNS